MQSLEIQSRQEADFKLNNTLSKIKRHAAAATASSHSDSHRKSVHHQSHQSLLLKRHSDASDDHRHHRHKTNNHNNRNHSHHSHHSKHNSSSRPSATSVSHTSTSSKSTSTATATATSTSTATATSTSTSATAKPANDNAKKNGSTEPKPFFDIHEKLRELYMYLYLKDIHSAQVDNRIKLRGRSFLLETLVAREKLNTVILNLYPGNKGYSLAFRQDFPAQNKPHDGLHNVFLRRAPKPMDASNTTQKDLEQEEEEHLLETVPWPYDVGDLLASVDREELPILYMKLFVSYAPNAFYSGCVIVEVRDYRQSFPLATCCDNYYVLLKPTTQTLLADVKVIAAREDYSHEDRVLLESNLVLATADPLCLDPSPKVARKAFYGQFKRQMWNSTAIRRQMKKFSQVAINRKRKTDQFSHTYGLDLSEYLIRSRVKPRPPPQTFDASTTATSKIPRKPSDVVKPIRSPNLDFPTTLKPPSSVNVEQYAKAYERPRETKDCMPQLIEEYVLETDRGGGRVYHIKLSIYQRPANSEYLGELYVDRDYESGVRNGEACQFSLGTRAHANRYIQQFTEIFTEEGRKSVKITHLVPGQPPKVSCTTGMIEHRSHPPASQQPKTPQQMQQPQLPQLPQQSPQPQQPQQQHPPSQPQTHQNVKQPQLEKFYPHIPNGTLVVVQEVPIPQGLSGASPQRKQRQFQQIAVAVTNQPQHHQLQQQRKPQQQQNQNTIPRQSQATGIQAAKNLPPRTPQQAQTQQLLQHPNGQTNNKKTPTNPEMNAVIIQSTNQLQPQGGNAQSIKTNNNAAIISLLNSAPAAMTSSTVVNNINNTPSTSPMTQSLQANNSNQTIDQRLNHGTLTQSGGGTPRQITSKPATTPPIAGTPPLQQQQQQQQRYQRELKRRESMTAPSPGSDSNASNASSSNHGCSSNSSAMNPGFPSMGSATSPTTSVISNDGSACQISNQSAAALSERLNSNSNSISQSSPLSTGGGPSPKSNLSQHIQVQSPASRSPLSSPPPQIQQHLQPQTQTVGSIAVTTSNVDRGLARSLSNPSSMPQNHDGNAQHPQTTTLNLQGINVQSLQGAMATFPGLQNVQVQIPGLAQPISLSLSSSSGATLATTNPHHPSTTTGLLVSVPGTNTSQLQTVSTTIPASTVLGQTAQTVVLTTAGQPGQSGSVLSVPIAQLVAASNVKTLNQQHLRAASNLNSAITGVNVNLGTAIQSQQQQRPRSVPTMATSPISAKQLTARGIITTQRNIVAASPNAPQMKITTPMTMSSNPTGTNMTGVINNNNSVVLTAQLHLQKQAQMQQQLQQNIKLSNNPITQQQAGVNNSTSNDGTTVLIANNNTQNSLVNAVAALQNKNRRRSTPTDLNK